MKRRRFETPIIEARTYEVTRLNPKLITRGHLEPGEPLYVVMTVSDRRVERELAALRDADQHCWGAL